MRWFFPLSLSDCRRCLWRSSTSRNWMLCSAGGLLWTRMTGESQWNAWMTDYSRLCRSGDSSGIRGIWLTVQKDGLVVQQCRIPATTGPTIFHSHHFEGVDAHIKDGTTFGTNLFNPNFNIHHGLSLLELTHFGSVWRVVCWFLSTLVFIVVYI